MRSRPRLATIILATTALVTGLLVGLPAGHATGTGTGTGTGTSKHLAVGSARLRRCTLSDSGKHPSYCGSIEVPLNYRARQRDGKISTGFAWLPATSKNAGKNAPTIVAEEGGPGYPSTGTASDFVKMIGSKLLATHNLLLVDERGTGTSTPIDCKAMEKLHIVTTTPAFNQTVRSCGELLNHEFPRQGGGYVHASDLFDTANATRDMVRVLNKVGVMKVDLYGDSYGTYFSQSFLSHFPNRVRSVTLDSAYEARDLDPWYRTTVTTARKSFDKVCRRSVACHQAAAGKSWNRITRLAALLRHHPLTATAPGVDDKDVAVPLDITSLVNLVNDAGYDYDPYRQLDAAARAYLQHRDATPLARLYAQDIGYDYSDYNAAATYYSDGQYFAVGCTDYPQLFHMRWSPAKRRAEFRQAIRKEPKRTFAPFTVKEWVGVDPFTETYHACTSWPKQVHKTDPAVVPGKSMDASHVPVLILNGEIDSLTPAAGGAHIHRQIGSDSRHIVTANTVHLVGLDDHYGCGQSLVRRFINDPAKLHTMSDKCAARVPAVPAVGTYPRKVEQSQKLGLSHLDRVAVAVGEDAASRWNYIDGDTDVGLRGGTVRYHKGERTGVEIAVLNEDRWTTDATVSGTVEFSADALGGHGKLTVRTNGGRTSTCNFTWYLQSEVRMKPARH